MLEFLTLVITDKKIALVSIEASLHEANLHLPFYAKRTSVVCFFTELDSIIDMDFT